jgi:hypothetical protein
VATGDKGQIGIQQAPVGEATRQLGATIIEVPSGTTTAPVPGAGNINVHSEWITQCGPDGTLCEVISGAALSTNRGLVAHVATSALPSGAATSARQDTQTTAIQNVETAVDDVNATAALRHNLFASLLKAEAVVGQEIRIDDISAGDLYIGRANDGTATSAASWEVARYYRDSAGKMLRARYRTSVVWDNRTAGWS